MVTTACFQEQKDEIIENLRKERDELKATVKKLTRTRSGKHNQRNVFLQVEESDRNQYCKSMKSRLKNE